MGGVETPALARRQRALKAAQSVATAVDTLRLPRWLDASAHRGAQITRQDLITVLRLPRWLDASAHSLEGLAATVDLVTLRLPRWLDASAH